MISIQNLPFQLYDAIPHRHTNRNPYFLNPLPTDFVDGVRQLVSDEVNVKLFLFSAEADRSYIVGMICKANDVVYADSTSGSGQQNDGYA